MDAFETVGRARELTHAAGSARFEWRQDLDWSSVPRPPLWLRIPWRVVSRDLDFSHHRDRAGLLDLSGHRFQRVHSYGGAEIVAEGRRWDGRPGEARADSSSRTAPDPLWLVEVLAGLTAAEDRGRGNVFGHPCRRFAVTVDLDVLVDGVVRQVTFVENEVETKSVLLWDHGVPLGDVDWTRLPRDPGGDR